MDRKPVPQRRPVARKEVTLREPPRLAATPLARTLQPRLPSLPSPLLSPAPSEVADPRPNPYVDYARHFTPEGGIAITYKDIDDRLRWTILRWTLWSAAMALTSWYAFAASPLSLWFNLPALAIMGCVYWLIVCKPAEIYRRVEVRPDCLIIHDRDLTLELKIRQLEIRREQRIRLDGLCMALVGPRDEVALRHSWQPIGAM